MTSFGIEWETQEIIYYNPKYLLNGKGIWSETVIDNSEQKCNIACEQWEGADEYDPELCTHNLEVRLGVFYGNTNTFNTYEFTKACDKFMTYWKDIIKQKKITIREIDHDIFTRIINPSDTGDTYYTTCKAVKEKEGKNSYPTTKQEKYEWAYTQNLQLTGIPQITIGVQYKYVFHLFKFIHDKLKNPVTNVENIRSYYYLKNISRAFIDTVNDISENDPVDVIIFILLCNNHIISEKETAKYRKSSYIFKVRTNLGNMYASLEASSKKRITEWKENKLNSYITPRQQEILNNIFVENKGYVLENDEQFKKVGFNNLTILPDNTIKDDHIKSVLKHVVYSKFFTKYADEDSDTLIYDKNTNSIIRLAVPIDIGEWEYTDNTVHIELRGVVSILQLLEKYNSKPNSRIKEESLCKDVKFLLDNLSGVLKNDFPDEKQIAMLKIEN